MTTTHVTTIHATDILHVILNYLNGDTVDDKLVKDIVDAVHHIVNEKGE